MTRASLAWAIRSDSGRAMSPYLASPWSANSSGARTAALLDQAPRHVGDVLMHADDLADHQHHRRIASVQQRGGEAAARRRAHEVATAEVTRRHQAIELLLNHPDALRG